LEPNQTSVQTFCTQLIRLGNVTNMTGTIKNITDKGFGFIAVEGEEKEIFFHSSALVGVEFNELKSGDTVTFDVEDSEKGPRAANVQLAA
jgi:cold shock protein